MLNILLDLILHKLSELELLKIIKEYVADWA